MIGQQQLQLWNDAKKVYPWLEPVFTHGVTCISSLIFYKFYWPSLYNLPVASRALCEKPERFVKIGADFSESAPYFMRTFSGLYNLPFAFSLAKRIHQTIFLAHIYPKFKDTSFYKITSKAVIDAKNKASDTCVKLGVPQFATEVDSIASLFFTTGFHVLSLRTLLYRGPSKLSVLNAIYIAYCKQPPIEISRFQFIRENIFGRIGWVGAASFPEGRITRVLIDGFRQPTTIPREMFGAFFG